MQLIAAVDRNWGLGKDGRLLFSIPEDLARFKALTIGGTVIMGRKTLESLPGGRPLPGRVNVVLSKQTGYSPEGVLTCADLNRLEELLPVLPAPISVIGGGEVYRQLLDRCTTLHITKIHASASADVFFPNVDLLPQWQLAAREEQIGGSGLTVSYCTYERRAGI